MDKRDVFRSLNEIEYHLENLTCQVREMKNELTDVVENLEIENQHVRDRLQELEYTHEQEANQEREQYLEQSKVTLEKLYAEGYHVCPERYGARLDDNADGCMFCLSVIDKLNRKA